MHKVRAAGSKGLGVFATKLIPRGTRIFAERPIFGIRNGQGPKDIYPAFLALNHADRATVLGLSSHATHRLEFLRWVHVARYTLSSWTAPSITSLREHKTLLNVFRSNAFSLNADSEYAQAIFPRIARLNHECVPNAQANFNDQANAMHVHTLRDVQPHEEITLSYLDDSGEMKTLDRQQKLESYGFVCACPICAEGQPSASDSAKRRQAIDRVMESLSERVSQQETQASRSHELEALMEIIELMRAEGLVGRELAARYFAAAEWHMELGDLQGAVVCATKGLEIDQYALGEDHETYVQNQAKVAGYTEALAAMGART
ncbi:uncharacterized protein PV09_07687 [Verruconis gallopava]|uniref:SET domain-containing protein n=1 Tax=Verruconis gallopava TaxID=253628 RepID=A0A0D1XER8_9PEZI|nr:uncharacterized protein PV09_07687 [Verruconis gallopava]KIW00701.1 hypothetical protein PV09_07687 [Verruconis gallopava]